MARPSEVATWFSYDRALLAALVDKSHPETHMFHLPCGEMTPMLEDVSLLMGLTCASAAVGARDASVGWHDEMLDRFSIVERREGVAPFRAFLGTKKHNPTKAFLVQFVARMSCTILSSCLSY